MPFPEKRFLLLCMLLLCTGCGAGPVKVGDTITVAYTARLADGTVFDKNDQDKPVEFTVGDSTMIPGFNHAVIGMLPGEERTVSIPPKDAYGIYDPEKTGRLTRDKVPERYTLQIGRPLNVSDEHGRQIPAIIREITDEYVVVDMNHPLAGKVIELTISV